ncbi:hypothetical protein M3201_26465 [Paenibacillus motobuensis]|nr:hypothetical protein [Paenibacillus lutimineralis]MCM3650284.1 hypothetical protein [Paenibacillus motobuensis]
MEAGKKNLEITAKNSPAYGERHGLKDNAVNWGVLLCTVKKKTVKGCSISQLAK